MEVEKTGVAPARDSGRLHAGDAVRVRIVGKTAEHGVLVDVGGRLLRAHVSGRITSPLFIARVLRTSPRIALKFLRSLDKGGSPVKLDKLEELLRDKKEIIHKRYDTDIFSIARVLPRPGGPVNLRNTFARILRDQNASRLMTRRRGLSQALTEFFVLQNLFNLAQADSFAFLFPLSFGDRRFLCDLKLFGSREDDDHSVYLSLTLEDGRRMGFFVYLDHELISCSVSANEESLEGLLREGSGRLDGNLRSLGLGRRVTIDFVPFSQHCALSSSAVKKIDVKM